MTHTNRVSVALVAVLAALAAFVAGATLAAATDAPPESDAPAIDAPEPAIPLPDESPEAITPEWPYRFLVPAALLLGTLAVLGTIVMYFVRVTRNRYRVIE